MDVPESAVAPADVRRAVARSLATAQSATRQAAPNASADDQNVHACEIVLRVLALGFLQADGLLDGDRAFLQRTLERADAKHRVFALDIDLLLFDGLSVEPDQRRPVTQRLGRLPYLQKDFAVRTTLERIHQNAWLPNWVYHALIDDLVTRLPLRRAEDGGVGLDVLGAVVEAAVSDGERRAGGTFFTPPEIAARVVGATLPALRRRSPLPITILDPACGAGVFLGAALDALAADATRRGHDADLRVIARSSLFGMDTNPLAVRAATLRLWLGILLAERTRIEDVRPLPSMDRNLIVGDALLSRTDGLADERERAYAACEAARGLQRQLVAYYHRVPPAGRKDVRHDLETIDRRIAYSVLEERVRRTDAAFKGELRGRKPKLARCRKLYAAHQEAKSQLQHVNNERPVGLAVQFAPILARGGFDVVVGNPPWVRASHLTAATRSALADRYELTRGTGRSFHQPDLAVAFVARAWDVVRTDGVVGLVVPASLATAGYAERLRQAIGPHLLSMLLLDATGGWCGNQVPPIGVVFRRGRVEQKVAGAPWVLARPAVQVLIRRIAASCPPLSVALERTPLMGVKTGNNAALFVRVAKETSEAVITEDGIRIPVAHVRRCVRGRDIARWAIRGHVWMLWPLSWRGTLPDWLEAHAQACGVEVAELRLAYSRPEHEGLQVIWKDVSRGMQATVLTQDGSVLLVPNQTLYTLPARTMEEAHVIAAVLNTTIPGALLVSRAARVKDAHYRYFGRTVGALPWPDTQEVAQELVALSLRAHAGGDMGDVLDAAVARAYGLSEEENGVLREFLAERLAV